MAKIREGNKTALLIVDVQVGVVEGAWETDRIISNVMLARDRARKAGAPVIWVQHSDKDLHHGSPEWQLVPGLDPIEGEFLIDKNHESSFENTGLEDELSGLGVSHLVLCGLATNWCIRATAYGALDRGYDLTLIEDGHTTKSIELGDDKHIAAENLITDLNIVMKWLSYPDRRNAIAAAAEIGFTSRGA